jgi:dihydrofolate synthase/folylpolyglutamate synthase
MKIQDMDEANKILMGFVPLARHITGKDVTVERTRPLLKAAGNPHERLKIIHVAGTSGKTSTSYYIASLIKATGSKVGLTVSPHIDSVTERIQVNGAPLSDADFCSYLGDFMEIINELNPTYFELMIAFALWVFDRLKVKYVVVETGLGGLHDSTNIAERPDKVCVITDIGFDHMNILGNTLRSIASQKAGIIHAYNHVIMYDQSPEIMNAMFKQTNQEHATLDLLNEAELDDEFEPAILGLPLFQRRNWLLARAVAQYVIVRDNLPRFDTTAALKSMHIRIPGRMDTEKFGTKKIVMDGAHNHQKMTAFVGSFKAEYPGQKAAVLLAVKDGKDYQPVIDDLLPITSQFILSSFGGTQDLPVYSVDPQLIASYCDKVGFSSYEIIKNAAEAYAKLRSLPDDLLVVTGSLYLLGQVRVSISQ